MNTVNIPVPAVIRQSWLSEKQIAAIELRGMTVKPSAANDMHEVELSGDAESRILEMKIEAALKRISR